MTRWDVLDWRRRVAGTYAEVRAAETPADGHALWVRERARLLTTHRASPVPATSRSTFRGPLFAPYDPDYRYVVAVDRDVEPFTRTVTTGTDGLVPLDRVGRVQLPGVGSLDLWWVGEYGGGILLPLRDATCGRTAYGGGRYVLDTVKGADLGGPPDALVVDLDFAYQPSCAYDEEWACPLPGIENTVAVAVPVGELYVSPDPGHAASVP